MSDTLAPFTYLIVDARRWLVTIALVLVGCRLLRGPFSRALAPLAAWWRSPSAARGTAGVLALTAVFVVVASTPRLRFTNVLHGDEPKYLRVCESFYQGLGFDITDVRPVKALPAHTPPMTLGTVKLFAGAIATESRALERDLRAVRRGRTTFNRAVYTGAWFLRGKDGRVYQVHNPGLSFFLFPGFVLDQWLMSDGAAGNGQFPNSLFFTSLTLLAIYAMWTAVLFDLYASTFREQGAAALMAGAAVLTLPVAAMPFQIYPETLAGLTIALVVRHVFFSERPTTPGSGAAGLAASLLPWLHIRFLPISLLWAAAALLRTARTGRHRTGFAAGYAVGMGLLCLYGYHVTGSLLPTATYFAEQSAEALKLPAMLPGMIGELFDRDYGLLSYSPVYLLALPGIVPFCKRAPWQAVMLAATVVSLAAVSAGHSWNAAGGSPLRHVVAAIPLALVPAGETIQRWRGSRVFWVMAGLLLFFSLQNAVAYNLHHQKEIGPMLDASVSGWKTLLMFPFVFEPEAMTRTVFLFTPLLAVWLTICAGLLALPLVSGRSANRSVASRRWPIEALVLTGLLAVALAGVVVGAATGVRSSPQYSQPR